MAAEMMDIGLVTVSDGEDLAIKGGDFIIAESTATHQTELILNNKGEFKQNPTICVGAINYIDDDNASDLLRAISKEFLQDGCDVKKVALGANNVISTDAYYTVANGGNVTNNDAPTSIGAPAGTAVFGITYPTLIWQDLPVRLRQNIMFAWLKALVAPVIYLYNLFSTNRTANLYFLAHNSQVCYMQAALNDTFDNALRRIYITDGIYDDPVYIYMEDEDKPVWLGLVSEEGSTPYTDPIPLYLDSETYSFGVDFIVHVPVAIAFDNDRMKALIDEYRLPSKNNYTIVTF